MNFNHTTYKKVKFILPFGERVEESNLPSQLTPARTNGFEARGAHQGHIPPKKTIDNYTIKCLNFIYFIDILLLFKALMVTNIITDIAIISAATGAENFNP